MDELSGSITTAGGEAFSLRRGDTLMISGGTRLDGTRDEGLDGWYTVRKVRGLWRHRLQAWWSLRAFRLRYRMHRVLDWFRGAG